MKIIDSSPSLAKRVAMKGIEKFRKAYKVPIPYRIRNAAIVSPITPICVGYAWTNIGNKKCEVWVLTNREETKWNCFVTDDKSSMTMPPFINAKCTEECEMAQDVARCLELWFDMNMKI